MTWLCIRLRLMASYRRMYYVCFHDMAIGPVILWRSVMWHQSCYDMDLQRIVITSYIARSVAYTCEIYGHVLLWYDNWILRLFDVVDRAWISFCVRRTLTRYRTLKRRDVLTPLKVQKILASYSSVTGADCKNTPQVSLCYMCQVFFASMDL